MWENTWIRNHYTERKIQSAKVSHVMIACNDAVQILEYNEIQALHQVKAKFVIKSH